MTNAELIACIQAEERGEVVEFEYEGIWMRKPADGKWDTERCTYRIRREPRKCWVKWNKEGIPEAFRVLPPDDVEKLQKDGWQLIVEEIK